MTPPGERAPVVDGERIVAIDVVRGFALLGILIMNVQSFAMVDAAYFNPSAYGDYSGTHKLVHSLSHILADQKFMTIFSMLFGAGIVLMLSRAERQGQPVRGLHYRRMFVLLLFGIAHAYLLWHGDILVYYALCGMIVFPFRHRRIRTQLLLGFIMLSVSSGLYIFSGLTLPMWPEEAVAGFLSDWDPSPQEVEAQLMIFRGGWLGQLGPRAEKSFEFHTFVFLFWGMWRAGGLMLIGMALYRKGVFSARRTARFYWGLVGAAIVVGLPVVAYGLKAAIDSGWNMKYVFFIGGQYNYWGSIVVSMGWVGAIMLVVKAGILKHLTAGFAAVGRMALSNYIGQTILCTLLFYGHGLGYYGHIERAGQVGVLVAVWTIQLTVSPLWLRRFRFGPLEWLWRTLTYGERQSLRR